MLLLVVLICTNVVLRRRWLDGEHLACPLISLPIQISTPQAGLFRNKLFWAGFALVASIEIWNSFAFYYPATRNFLNKPAFFCTEKSVYSFFAPGSK